MMSLTDDEQDVASRLPTPQKAPRAPVDENLSPTALEAIKAAEQRRKPRRPPPPMPRATPPGARPPTHRAHRAPATAGSLDDDESSESSLTEDPRENNDDERRASEVMDAPSEVWTPVGPVDTFGAKSSSGSPRAGSPRPSLLDRARRISPPPSRSQSPPTAPPAKEWPP